MLSTGYSLYFENAAVRVLEHPAGFAIFQYQAGPRSLADLQAAVTHFDNLLHRRHWSMVLNDQRRMQAFTQEETAWIKAYWRTHLDRHPNGLYAAVLMPQDVFARLAAGQLRHDHQTNAPGISYCLFDDGANALAWLKQVR